MTVLRTKIPTSHKGIFYKEIIDSNKKAVDKVYVIRYRDESGREK